MQQRKIRRFSLASQVALLTTSRTVVNTGSRMPYALLPVFAREVQVDVASIAIVLTIVQLLGLTAPFMGQISEQRGRRFTMLLGLILFIMGLLIVFILPNFLGLALALIVSSLGKVTFDPAIQAYIGDKVPYEKRGLYLGIIEFGWASAFLIGVPIMTWLIAQFNWQAPFIALAIVATLLFIIAFVMLEPDRPEIINRVPFFTAVRQSVSTPLALAGLALGFGISGANQFVTVIFSTWIENSFGIQLTALAAASAVIGISELGGEGIVTGLSDRFGKRRIVLFGIIGNIIACILLPFSAISLTVALMGLFFFYFTFETALVASIPLATELSPQSRAMYMTVYFAVVTFGRAIVTPLAPLFFEGGLLVNTGAAIIFNGIALFAVWRYIRNL